MHHSVPADAGPWFRRQPTGQAPPGATYSWHRASRTPITAHSTSCPGLTHSARRTFGSVQPPGLSARNRGAQKRPTPQRSVSGKW